MAVLARVAGGVRTVEATSSQLGTVTLGEGGEAGEAYRISSADSKAYLVDANVIDPAGADFDGYLKDGGVADEVVSVQTGGKIYLGVDTIEGMFYGASATVGETEELTSALVSGNVGTVFGYGDADGNLVISKIESGGLIPT